MALRRPGMLFGNELMSSENILKQINGARGRSKINFEVEHQLLNRPSGLSTSFNSSDSPSPGLSSPEFFCDRTRERNPSAASLSETGCSCNRSPRFIQCRTCGFVFKGRVRHACLEHPNVIHLMDLFACANCEEENLMEFGDIDFLQDDGSHKMRTC